MVRRLWLLASLLCLVAVGGPACSSAPDEKQDESLTQAAVGGPAFLEDIPANSPYVMTSLEPFPMEVLEPYMTTYAKLYGSIHPQGPQSPHGYGGAGQSGDEFILALLEELTKAEDIDGYRELGLSTRPQVAVYGVGWFPVMRMTLGDAEAFEAMISRVETRSGLEVAMETVGGQTYRRYELGDQARVALAVGEDEVVVGAAHADAFDEFVAYMLGHKKPARSLADVEVIEHIRSRYEFMPYAVGYADIEAIASAASGAAPGDEITGAMLEAVDYAPPALTEVCRGELMSMVEQAPRAVVGYTELSPDLMEVTAVLETKGDFAGELAKTRAPMPAYGTELVDDSFAAAGLGVDVQKLMGFVIRQADRVNQDPFECPQFQSWNDFAQQARMAGQLIPSFVRSLRGAMAVVSDVEMDRQGFEPAEVEALAMVGSGDPAALYSQLQMYLPQLQGVTVQADGVPVALGAIPGASWLQVPHVAMDADTIAASGGVGMQDEMAVLLEDRDDGGAQEAPMLLLAYDYAKFMDALAQRTGAYQAGAGVNPVGNTLETLKSMFGTFVGEVDANDNGIVMRYRLNMFLGAD